MFSGGGAAITLEVQSQRARDMLVVKLHKLCVETQLANPKDIATGDIDQMQRKEEMAAEHQRLTEEFKAEVFGRTSKG